MRGEAAGIQIVTVGRGDIEETVTALGRLQPQAQVDVGAQVSGQVTRILVQPGDLVAAGDLLVEIDPQIPQAKVESNRAELARLRAELDHAMAQHEFAVLEHDRQQRLQRARAASGRQLEQARRDQRIAAARIAALEAQIAQTESTLKADLAELGYTRIYAPMAGTVLSVDARQGQTINATYSTPTLLRIADLSTMTVWTEVSEADVPQLQLGMELYFTTLGQPELRVTARLRQILPAPHQLDREGRDGADTRPAPGGQGHVVFYTALFDVDNAAGEFRPEMTAQVFFLTASARNVLTVPTTVLTPKDPANGLYTAPVLTADGRIETRDIRIGTRTRLAAEVVAGLSAGEQVVTDDGTGGADDALIRFRL
jgi:macrolide-specific efflux system membrane fusion protein